MLSSFVISFIGCVVFSVLVSLLLSSIIRLFLYSFNALGLEKEYPVCCHPLYKIGPGQEALPKVFSKKADSILVDLRNV